MPPTGLAYLPHKHLLYAPQLRVVQAERDCVLSMEQQSVCPGAAVLNGDYIWDNDPHTCQFTDFELTDSRDAERLDRFAQTADEIRIADRVFGSRPECIRSLAFGEADYIVRVHWRGSRWLTAEGMRFDMMGFLRGLDCGKNGETTVMIGNSGNKKAGAPFPARLIAVSLPPEKALISKTRLLSENRRKGRVVQAETLEAAGHVLLLTSLPEDEYSAEQVADCYRLRWQIELAFKRLKSLLHLDALCKGT